MEQFMGNAIEQGTPMIRVDCDLPIGPIAEGIVGYALCFFGATKGNSPCLPIKPELYNFSSGSPFFHKVARRLRAF